MSTGHVQRKKEEETNQVHLSQLDKPVI
jgi:hypothetical protein